MYGSVRVTVPQVALLLLLTTVVPGSHSCPRSCNCYQASEVHCTFRSLLTVPPGLPSHTRRINLGFNSINTIHGTSLAGLTEAELLMLHSNSLQHLPDAVFKDMKSLQILKLSYNKLREISSSLTFSGLTSLLRLYLDHNLLEYIHPRALLQLPGLRLLRLQGNRLHQLHPHTLCTLSLLNTYYFSTLRHLDVSNNSLTTLAKDTLTTAPLLETVMLQANPWSCDCRMNWLSAWSLAHPGLMKCPGGPQCPTCASPNSLQGQGLLDQIDLKCTSSFISVPGRHPPLETEPSEIQTRDTLREPLGSAFLGLSDQQGNSVDLSCNITLFSDSQDISNSPDLSLTSSSPIPLALSLSLECPTDRESYEILWRILAYYSETAVRLEREIMLGKEPALAFRYRQVAEADGYYHTGVKAAVKVKPQWLLQPAVSIQLNRAQSNGNKVHLIYSTRVSAHPDPLSYPSTSSPAPHPWVLISANRTTAAFAAISGSKVEISCPLLSSGHPKVQWILPDGSKLNSPFRIQDGRIQASATGLLLRNVKLSDSGLYYCVAYAGKDVDVLPLRLAVEESSVPPSGEQVAPPVTGTVGEPVTLSCNAMGSPTPDLTWIMPDGNMLRSELVVPKGLTIQPNGSLSLPNPSVKDAGHYRCIAVNSYGSDALSTMLVFKSKPLPTLRTSFPRGPQSAAGRSTRIRAPLLNQILEGSGDEVEEDRSYVANRNLPRNNQRPPHTRYPNGSLRRRGPVRDGSLRRKGSEISSTDLRRNRFDTRHRMATNKQRIDPQKWADILAKIRLKTANNANSQPITTAQPTTAPVVDRETTRDEGVKILDRSTAEVTVVDDDIEGSSVDDSVLQEEGLQPIYPVLTEKRTDTVIERQKETSTLTQTTTETQTLSPGLYTEANTKTESNDIIQKTAERFNPGVNPKPHRTRPQYPWQRPLPNLATGTHPQKPWNTRRRIGQQRRITNRTRGQPLTPPKPHPDPTKQNSQTATPDTSTDQSHTLSAPTTTRPTLLTKNDPIRTGSSHSVNPLSPHISYSPSISDSGSVYLSLPSSAAPVTSLSPSYINPQTDTVTHSADILKTAESTFFNAVTPATTHSNVVISQMHVPDTHGTQTHTNPHTVLGKHIDEPFSKDGERNLLDVSHESYSNSLSSSRLSVISSTASSPTTAETTTLQTTLKSSLLTSSVITTTSATTSTTVEDTPTTTASPVTTKQIMSSTARTMYAPLSMTMQSTAALPNFTTTLTPIVIQTTTSPSTISPTTTTSPTTTPTTTSTTPTTTTSPTTSTTTTSFTSTRPSTMTSTTGRSIKTLDKFILTTRNYSPTTSTATTTTTEATTRAPAITPLTSTTTTSTSTRLVTFRERPSAGRFNTQGRPVPGASSQSQSPPDWRNPGANSIPDSHSSRPHWSPSLPAVPGPSVSRSRPRIADPHIRVVSFPADSTARLTCEAEGEPKPSITWTKVATGAVMSIHSKAQRFEVLPNGTLVIQNVQLQDRGTYICSAQSFLGRDRLLTTLEVRTRPPRMQLASYREATIHQGGEVLLECQADGVPAPLLSWVLPDRTVLTFSAPLAKHISMDTNGTLHISGTLPRDRGMYRCVASNSAGAASSSVRLHVSSLPPVIQQSRVEHLLLPPGRPLYAHCSARGAPPPTLRWRIPDGTLVRPSQFLHGNLFVLPNGTLHISRVEPKDSGSYECTASNAVGADKRTVSVKIQLEAGGERSGGVQKEMKETGGKTSAPHSPRDRTVYNPVDQTNIFNIPKVSPPLFADRSRTPQISPDFSDPPSNSHTPNFTYSPAKSNKTVNVSTTHLTNVDKTNTAKLQLSNAHNPKVPPSSPHNKSRASAVLHPLPVSPFTKAQITSTSAPITSVHYGGFLQLHCSVTGTPAPIIIWRTPVRKLVDVNFSFDSRLKVHPNGTLSVRAVTEKDAGDYLCIARNKVADDYRLLRVSVATQPPKIEPKHPLNQMVSFGKPLKVDCQASGLPDPAVHWSLPDGTMVNSVLQGEDRGGRTRRLTVFDNGTLLVPAVGMREEGEYTCYAENQGGQDTMKVKVKVMMSSPPVFTDEKTYQTIKVRQGTTASIRCQARGDPAPRVTWLSPGNRVIPQSLGSGFYFERVVVVSGGTLEIRQAQKIDTGNYTCRASNSAGERNMVVSLEVEPFNHLISGQVGGRATNINHAGRTPYGFTSGTLSNLDARNSISTGHSNINVQPNVGINAASSGSNPALRSDHRNGYNRPVSGITTPFGRSVSGGGASTVARNVDNKADDIGSSSSSGIASGNSVVTSRSTATADGVEKNSGRNFNDVLTGRAANVDNGQTSPASRSSSANNGGREAGASRGSWYSRSSYAGIASDDIRKSGIPAVSHSGQKNSTSTVVGVVSRGKQKVVRGTTVLLPCPSHGSPPPRVTWLLPGNGVLPSPHYGSRQTVHRNGSLEVRGVRPTDAGTLVCVVSGERGETRIHVELEVSDSQEEPRYAHREPVMEKLVQKTAGLLETRQSGGSLDSTRSSDPVLSDKPRPRFPVTQHPPQRGLTLPPAARPLGFPPQSAGVRSEAAVSTRTGSIVTIISGETLRLLCPPPQNPRYDQSSLLWTMPSGNVLSRGESADSGRYTVHEDGTLIVQQATTFDRGTYSCKSTSSNSSLISVLTVPVIIIAYPPRITIGPSPVTYTRPGVAVELPCLTIATPRATVIWETPDLAQLRTMGQARIYGNRYLSPQGSLVIQNPTSRDTGFYRCTAKNVIGIDTKATYLHVM